MRERILFAVYLALVVAISVTQNFVSLTGMGLVVLAVAGRDAPRLVRRAALAAGFFTGLVSLAWLVTAWIDGTVPWAALIRLNLRVFTLTLLTFTATERLDFERILAFAPRLQTLFVLIRAQVQVYRRLLADFRMAARSRTCRRPTLRDSLRLGAATGAAFLRRAEHSAEQMTQGMTSRGFFLDSSRESEPRP